MKPIGKSGPMKTNAVPVRKSMSEPDLQHLGAFQTALEEVISKYHSQVAQWGPGADHHDEVWAAILGKQVGQVSSDLLDQAPGLMARNLISVAAVALSWRARLLQRPLNSCRPKPHTSDEEEDNEDFCAKGM